MPWTADQMASYGDDHARLKDRIHALEGCLMFGTHPDRPGVTYRRIPYARIIAELEDLRRALVELEIEADRSWPWRPREQPQESTQRT